MKEFSLTNTITVFQSALWKLNSIHVQGYNTSLIFDPAYLPHEIQFILTKSSSEVWKENYVICTHGDYDHIVGIDWFENFKSVGSKAMNDKKDKARVIKQVVDFDQEFYVQRPYPIRFPDLNLVLDVQENLKCTLGTLEIHAFKAAGHTNDGMFIIIPEYKLWIAGDYLSDIEFPFVEDSMDEYLITLERASQIVDTYDIEYMIPGHGSSASTKDEIHRRIEQSKKYILSLQNDKVPHWKDTWGNSPFDLFLDKMHLKNISHVRSQSV